ncbi:MAG: phosphodiester glycosidase family protein [Silicimonas sp.]|jgi:uncharacterized protein YigE (DUF2233 family)|nr:phosphodiester glycosidase family protein [Silicimonas sp.]
MKTFAAIWITISFFSTPSFAATCRDASFEGTSFTVCEADPASEDVRLFLENPDGTPLGTFDNVVDAVEPKTLVWAMNAGMYHPDRSPVGLYVEDGRTFAKIVTREGPGNFGLLPNGVLCLGDGKAVIVESRAFAKRNPQCRYATQSGPMLVIEGALHPRFIPGSDSLNIRNGVGVAPDGRLFAAISNERVNFHMFARFFRDVLGTPNALFLDGKVSRLYAPELRRHDLGFPVGPLIGIVE